MKAKLLGALLLTPVVTVIDWQALVSWSLWFVVLMGIPVVGIAMLVAARIRQRPLIMTFGVAMLLAGLIGGLLAVYLHRDQAAHNMALGDQVATALDEHWGVHGSYPDTLMQLVPEYLEDVPTASVGVLASVPFWYMSSEREGGFVIGYEALRGIAAMRDKGKWSAVALPW